MAKNRAKLISGVSNNKPTGKDYRQKIDSMSSIRLQRYITMLENEGVTSNYLEERYVYAKAQLPLTIKREKELERQKELENQKKAKEQWLQEVKRSEAQENRNKKKAEL